MRRIGCLTSNPSVDHVQSDATFRSKPSAEIRSPAPFSRPGIVEIVFLKSRFPENEAYAPLNFHAAIVEIREYRALSLSSNRVGS